MTMSDTPTYEQLSALCEPVMYARDLDGTGSLHVCAKGDPGAIALYAEPPALPALCAQMAAALEKSRVAVLLWSPDPTEPVADIDAALTAYRTLSPDPQWQPGERFKWARFIVQHKPEHFRDHACKICVPEDRVIFPGGEDFVCVYHDAVALLEQSEEGRAILNRARGEG